VLDRSNCRSFLPTSCGSSTREWEWVSFWTGGFPRKKQTVLMDHKKSQLQEALSACLLEYVFSFLSITDLRSVRGVNKFQMRFPRWTVLELSHRDLLRFGMPLRNALNLFATRTERLETTSLRWYCDASDRFLPWNDIVPFLQRLRHLDVMLEVNDSDEDRADTAAMVNMSKLERLEWTGCIFCSTGDSNAALLSPVLQKMHLRVLHLSRCSTDARTFFGQLPVTLTELRLIETPTAFGRDQLARLLSACPELTRVELDLFGATARAMRPDDWSLLYSPTPRVWQEWSLSCSFEVDPLPCLGAAALDHFARANVQHTLSIMSCVNNQPYPWSSALWMRFVERIGASPLRVLRFGSLTVAAKPSDNLGTTLMKCFPNLEALPTCGRMDIDAQTLVRAYEKWPCMIRQRTFPSLCPIWNIQGESGDVFDYLIRAGPNDRFRELKLAKFVFNIPTILSRLPQLLLAQHHWQCIDIQLHDQDLSISDAVACHLAGLAKLETISIHVNRLTLSTTGLTHLLETGHFCRLVLQQDSAVEATTLLPVTVLKQLWRHRIRRTVVLRHACITGISAVEWSTLTREWISSHRVHFRSYVPATEQPIKLECGLEIESYVLPDSSHIAGICISTQPDHHVVIG
jgi:hypothetical protein